MEKSTTLRRNPSREACEGEIKRILMTEVLENGGNYHFRTAADFMDYFESLYPKSDALTKQVQRAVKALNMPKDHPARDRQDTFYLSPEFHSKQNP